jgi:hypothetical protein
VPSIKAMLEARIVAAKTHLPMNIFAADERKLTRHCFICVDLRLSAA